MTVIFSWYVLGETAVTMVGLMVVVVLAVVVVVGGIGVVVENFFW